MTEIKEDTGMTYTKIKKLQNSPLVLEIRIVIILGRGEDSDRKRALGAFWGTGNVLLLVYSAGYLGMFSF